MWVGLVPELGAGGARVCGCTVSGQGPARVTDRKVVPVDRSHSCRSQLLVVYLPLPRRH